jgi:hypothetical protein
MPVTYEINNTPETCGGPNRYVIDGYPERAHLQSVAFTGYHELEDSEGWTPDQVAPEIKFTFASQEERDRCLSSLKEACKKGDLTVTRRFPGSEELESHVGEARLGLEPTAEDKTTMAVELLDHNQGEGDVISYYTTLHPLLHWMTEHNWLTQPNVTEIIHATAKSLGQDSYEANGFSFEDFASALPKHLQDIARDEYSQTTRAKAASVRESHAQETRKENEAIAAKLEEMVKALAAQMQTTVPYLKGNMSCSASPEDEGWHIAFEGNDKLQEHIKANMTFATSLTKSEPSLVSSERGISGDLIEMMMAINTAISTLGGKKVDISEVVGRSMG